MEIWTTLRQEGWYLREEICQNLIVENEVPCNLTDIKSFILNTDLNEIGSGWNPEDKNKLMVAPSPMVLQIMSFRDVSQSQKSSTEHISTKKRILSIELTDGKKQYKCVEMSYIPQLDDKALLPGTKIRIKSNLKTLCGIWQLEPLSLEVLGGTVDALAEQWHTLNKIKNTRYKMKKEGQGQGKGQSQDGPPKFSHFNPNRRNEYQQQIQNVDNFSTKEVLNNNVTQVGGSKDQSENRVVDVEAGHGSGFGQMSHVARKKVLGDMKQENSRRGRGPGHGSGRTFINTQNENQKKENMLNKETKKFTLEEYEAQNKFNNKRLVNNNSTEDRNDKDTAAKDLMMNLFTYNTHEDNDNTKNTYNKRNNRGRRGGGGRGRGRRGRSRY